MKIPFFFFLYQRNQLFDKENIFDMKTEIVFSVLLFWLLTQHHSKKAEDFDFEYEFNKDMKIPATSFGIKRFRKDTLHYFTSHVLQGYYFRLSKL